ncbi:MAG TPA: protein-glutamate O-methyltransferase CheR [Thermodesulfovibrionales bacterium]|nr:protein-glutamate O-methyltransferase CheR [Thermodesulfovibrionales bacterium]
MFDREEAIPLREVEFRLLRDLIKEYCGLFFDDGSMFLLEKRLSRRLKVHQLNDFRDYYRFLLYDRKRDEELTCVIDLLTVNETFFFREQNQLKAFSDEILPELRETNRESKRIRIWSAGCSTGEEPYTIAMLALEYGYLYGWDIEILGSDINQRVLTTARRGVYRKNSFRSTGRSFVDKYFAEENGSFTISEEVKRLVSFSCLNLLDPFKAKFVGKMDVIFCRNVLIYFDQNARKKVVDTFYDSIVEGGYLLLGHAESLMNISTSFALRHLKNDMVYQKPILQERTAHVR